MTPETLFSLADVRGLSYQRIAPSTKPQWPMAEVALAMADMYPQSDRDKCYAAFAWRWTRDRNQYSVLWYRLLIATTERALRECWPRRISDQGYLEKLVDLALLEEHYWWVLRRHNLYAAMMRIEADEKQKKDGVTAEDIWERRYSQKYEAVRYQLEVWCGTVHGHMAARMKDEPNEQSIACA